MRTARPKADTIRCVRARHHRGLSALVATLEYGLELALEFAVECSPDHPWLTQHPEWFKWRPDRSVRTAERPLFGYRDPRFRLSVDRIGLWNAFRDAMLSG